VQHEPVGRRQAGGKGRFQIAGAVLREKLGYFVRIVQKCRRAELGKLQPESVILRRLRRVVRDGRKIQQLFFHAPSDTSQNKSLHPKTGYRRKKAVCFRFRQKQESIGQQSG